MTVQMKLQFKSNSKGTSEEPPKPGASLKSVMRKQDTNTTENSNKTTKPHGKSGSWNKWKAQYQQLKPKKTN